MATLNIKNLPDKLYRLPVRGARSSRAAVDPPLGGRYEGLLTGSRGLRLIDIDRAVAGGCPT